MSSNAPGQLLGYTLQFPRALFHLLRADVDDAISVEVIGDVATTKADNRLIVEEDKSSINGNPLTDRSKDLWKTFFNWIKASNDGIINIKKTRFILYTNQSGRIAIVNKFSIAEDAAKAKNEVTQAKASLNDIDENHEIWEYYNYVMNENESLLIEIVQRFELEIGSGTGLSEVKYEIKKKLVHENQIEFICDSLSGWLQRIICEKISLGVQAVVKFEEFKNEFIILFARARRRELIDFTLQYPLDSSEIENQIKIRPDYIKQLEIIKITDDEIFEAVTDFMKAKVNRDLWIEKEIIDETIAEELEVRLTAFWKNQSKKIKLTQASLNEYEKAQLLLIDCKNRQETIHDMTPPPSTIPGTFHSLANEQILGWHSEWKQNLTS